MFSDCGAALEEVALDDLDEARVGEEALPGAVEQ